MANLKKSEAFTMEREKEIQQVVELVNELAQIMKDLSVLVIDQGTIVDRIDHNIPNVAASMDEGLKQLQKKMRAGWKRYFKTEDEFVSFKANYNGPTTKTTSMQPRPANNPHILILLS
ncbi:putative target SNARE coiled-coil domain-containing protein [Helianthus annuus]|uniref:Putative target SNARE coiled-coil-like domain-containing protein n=1 Tax=Helianthus annuus TaxID=4232 RepID=A0A251RNP2_HELAN|nr:putative target SNARE coiled-coil domain-containing protein [Helianthus annuus]KAJ0812553.1 putative target SNARE coiled-coil domain-containing protein [Helianthus annuus]